MRSNKLYTALYALLLSPFLLLLLSSSPAVLRFSLFGQDYKFVQKMSALFARQLFRKSYNSDARIVINLAVVTHDDTDILFERDNFFLFHFSKM